MTVLAKVSSNPIDGPISLHNVNYQQCENRHFGPEDGGSMYVGNDIIACNHTV
jgi:hypothetical protein